MNAASEVASACAPPIIDQAMKIAANPVRVPTRSMKVPTGTCPAIIPTWKPTAM